MKKSKPKIYFIVLFEFFLSLIFSAIYFTYVADIVAEKSNYFIAIAIVPIVVGTLVGWLWHLVNLQLLFTNGIRLYQLIMAHIAVCLAPTLLYLLVMSASG